MKALIIDDPFNKVKNSRGIPEKFIFMINALAQGGIKARYFTPSGRTELVQKLSDDTVDIVFCSIYGIRDEYGRIQIVHEILDKLGIPYIGSDASSLRLALQKSALKAEWKNHSVETPTWLSLNEVEIEKDQFENKLRDFSTFPCIVKPENSGNSRGISVNSIAETTEELIKKAEEICQRFGEVIVEEYLGLDPDFQEYTVAWIGNGQSALILPAEISLQLEKKYPIISTLDKEAHLTMIKQMEDDEQWRALREFASKAFSIAGVRDYARLDIIRSRGILHAIEINGQPMVPDRWFEVCANGAGMNPVQYICAIFFAGLIRNNREGHEALSIPPEMHWIIPLPVLSILLSDF
jgi:D-alanine-D-alanine ligase